MAHKNKMTSQTKKNNKLKCLMCGQTVKKGKYSIHKDMTMTAVQLNKEAEHRSKMDYLMAKALLTGKIDSRVISWAEQLVYIYEKMKKL